MNIFISWSKELSHQCAEAVRVWIKCTLQASEPWISSSDIDKGSTWFSEISNQLQDTKVGIVCLTKENKNNPWILFESGALAKGIAASRVCTLLIDLTPADLEGPLAQFNHTLLKKADMKKLLNTINQELGDRALGSDVFNQAFDVNWPSFDAKIKDILKNKPGNDEVEPERSNDDILTEILMSTRSLGKRLSKIESRQNTINLPFGSNRDPLNILPNNDRKMTLQNLVEYALSEYEDEDLFKEADSADGLVELYGTLAEKQIIKDTNSDTTSIFDAMNDVIKKRKDRHF